MRTRIVLGTPISTSDNLNSLNGAHMGDSRGTTLVVIQGATKRLD